MSRAVWGSYYGGNCSRCQQYFPAGTPVTYEGGRIVEAECRNPEPAEPGVAMGPNELRVYREAMCLKCFTVHAPGQEGCA